MKYDGRIYRRTLVMCFIYPFSTKWPRKDGLWEGTDQEDSRPLILNGSTKPTKTSRELPSEDGGTKYYYTPMTGMNWSGSAHAYGPTKLDKWGGKYCRAFLLRNGQVFSTKVRW